VIRRRVLPALAGCLLVLLTASLWRWRFERSAPRLDAAFTRDFQGWTQKSPGRIGVEGDAWVLPPPAAGASAAAEIGLPGLEQHRYLHVAFDAAWEDIVRKDGRAWWSGRFSLALRDASGRYHWPSDGDLINAVGTRGRHRVERVLDLPSVPGEIRLVLVNLAASGTLRTAALEVTPVRQRAWVPAAAVAVATAWTAWFAWLAGAALAHWRRLGLALTMVAGAALLVFPQPQYHALPLPGGFALGEEIPAPLAAPPPPSPPPVAPPAAPAVARPSPPAPPVAAAPQQARRATHPAADVVRKVDHDFPLAHVVVFLALGLATSLLAGARRGWRWALPVALLSEVLPNLLRQDFQRDDLLDLAGNLAGVAVATVAALAAATWVRRRKDRSARG
jgi:hypothetical protein